ncbi:hypothetical protein CYG68_11120 [Morganella morganii]|uniref:Uncharacterized protein n=1 Tax=Morganella morganii TaxID=582 RepID=A0A8I0PWR8_MORMO|nr:hypothetical protein [Morganella morganii]
MFNIPVCHIISERKVSTDAISFLLLSDRTTGVPKLPPRTHNDDLYSVRESARICGLDEPEPEVWIDLSALLLA